MVSPEVLILVNQACHIAARESKRRCGGLPFLRMIKLATLLHKQQKKSTGHVLNAGCVCTVQEYRDMTCHLLLLVCISSSPLDRWAFGNPSKPLLQMRESFHVLLRQAAKFIYLDPWPRANVGDGVFALACTCKVLTRLPGVFA